MEDYRKYIYIENSLLLLYSYKSDQRKSYTGNDTHFSILISKFILFTQ